MQDAVHSPIVRLNGANEAVADSRDVADYFGRNHKDVLRAVRDLNCSAEFKQRNFAPFKIKDLAGESTSHVEMTRDGFMFVALGFTGGRAGTFKERFLAQFNAMEAKLRTKPEFDPSTLLTDPAAMRGLLLSYTEKVIALEGQVSELAPKADALDRIATAEGSLCITDAAKALQIGPRALFSYLRAHGWIYRRLGTSYDLGYQSRVAAGHLEHKVMTVTRPDGTERILEQVRVTPKGLAALAKLMPSVATRAA